MIKTLGKMIEIANEQRKKISEVVIEMTAEDTGMAKEDIIKQMSEALAVMKASAEEGLAKGMRSVSGITPDWAYRVKTRSDEQRGFAGDFVMQVIYTALSVSQVNASMGRIVAAPTAGSCGVLPACLLTLQRMRNLSDEEVVMGLLNASGVGIAIAQNATLAGAEGGCQAECGSASAMAASAMTEMLGGSPDMCGDACAHAIKSLMGLVCDPVAGLVEEPCIIRNPSSAMVALCSAELALAGVESIIPADEVISAMSRVGKQLPEALRETAEGGVAISETGKAIAIKLTGKDIPRICSD